MNIHVPPSGDRSGATDRRNIQRAIDDATTYGIGYQPATTCGRVRLGGHYFLDGPLRHGRAGEMFDGLANPPTINGDPLATIQAVGMWSDDYLLRSLGITRASALCVDRISGIHLLCDGKCRGLLAVGWHQYPSFHNIHVTGSVRSGIDCIACYTSRWAGIHVNKGDGYGVRFGVFNSASIRDLRVANMKSVTWPDVNDSVAVYEDGAPWNEQSAQGNMGRCAVYLDGNCLEAENVACEGNVMRDYPLVQMSTLSSRLNTLRCESNVANRCKVLIHGVINNRGRYNKIENIYARDVRGCRMAVEHTGQAIYNTVEMVNAIL